MDLPKRNTKSYPNRKTVCLSDEVFEVIQFLDRNGYNIPQMLRDAISEYVENKNLKEMVRDIKSESTSVNQNKLESTLN
jgi:metallophosphoesterase superfamily enzyme